MKLVKELVAAYKTVLEARKECQALEENVVPGARRNYRAIQEGFRTGKFRALDLLDAQRTLFAAKMRYIRVLGSYHKAVADLEFIMGEPLASGRHRRAGADRLGVARVFQAQGVAGF